MPLYSGATPPRSQACTVPTLSLPASLRWRPNHSQCTDNQMEAQARYYSQVPRAEKSLVGSESISSLQSLPKTAHSSSEALAPPMAVCEDTCLSQKAENMEEWRCQGQGGQTWKTSWEARLRVRQEQQPEAPLGKLRSRGIGPS